MAINLNQLMGKAGKALSSIPVAYNSGVGYNLRNLGNQLQSQAGYAMSKITPDTRAQTQQPWTQPGFTPLVLAPKSTGGGGSWGNSGGGGNIPSNINTGQDQQPYQQIQQQQDNGNAQIDADYEQSMGMLSSAEQGLQGQAANASGVIDTGAGDTRNQIQNTQALAEGGVAGELQTAQTQAKASAMQARDVFRQTQQQNSAQLSALGISSSSVTEALAERLGVETARRIAGVSDSLSSVQLNAQKELGRIKTYYSGQLTTLEKHVSDQKASIQGSLMQGLNQINQSRSRAASDKASARANLLSQTQSAISQLTQQQQQFEQSLQQWAAQKSAALTPVAQDPNYVNNLIAQAQNFNKQFSSTGFTYTPELNYDRYGRISGKITSNKKVEVDEFGNPVASNPDLSYLD